MRPALPESRPVLVPRNVDPTGTRDVTTALLDFLSRVPDGARVLFPPRSRYRVEGTVELVNRSRLVLDGNGSQFFATTVRSGQRAHWRLVGGSDLALRRMTIRGPNSAGGTSQAFHEELQWQHGIDIRGVRRIVVEQVSVNEVYGDCVYVGIGLDERWSEDVQLRDSTCRRNGRQGVAITAGRRVVIEHNRLAQTALMTFDLEPNGAPGGASDVLIRDNSIGSGARQQFLGIGGEGPVTRVRVERNALLGRPLTVVVVTPAGQVRSRIAILQNRSDTAYDAPNGAAITVQGVQALIVEGNLAPLRAPNMALVLLTCTTSAVVVGNTYPGGVTQVRQSRTRCPVAP